MCIQHPNEPHGNAARREWRRWIGEGQATFTPSQAVVAKAKGRYLWTVDGRRLLDFTSGVLVQNLGYAHPLFEKRFAQYRKGLPRNAYNQITPLVLQASKRLLKTLRANPNAQQLLWAASGSEAVQKAMWAALHRHPDRPVLLATRGGFHGKKGLAADVTGETSVNPNVRFISFPMGEPGPPARYEAELAALAAEFPGRIALLITEPYLGARGSYHPPAWYHQLLQAWCRSHDVPFIFDEVQSCFGRTGNMYAFESYGVQPDLVVLGKGLANGEPAAAVAGRADLIGALTYGEASDTFSASTSPCAAVCAALDVFSEERIVRQARRAARVLRQTLDRLADRFDFITDVRGEGMVYGVEIRDGETALRCVLEAYLATRRRGVHFLGPLAGKVLRVSPPLTITGEELREAEALLETAWARV